MARSVDQSEIDARASDDGWWFEPKLDGHRLLVHVVDNVPRVLNRRGDLYTYRSPGRVIDCFRSGFSGEWVLDGELIGDRLYLFDVLRVGQDMTRAPYRERRAVLEQLFEIWDPPTDWPIRLVPVARTTAEKRAMAQECVDTGAEGVMIKNPDSPYAQGRRSHGMLKAKFLSTVDLVVTEVNRQGKDSIGVSVVNPAGELVEVGALDVQGKPGVKRGDVVEARYAYAHPVSKRLVGAVLLRVRHDKAPQECTIDQLQFPLREVA